MNIGIFGGSFDPPHQGHLEVARAAQTHARLDKVLFIPAKKNPLKKETPHAADEFRIEMIQALIESDPLFLIDERELHRPSPSYTIDTIRSLSAEFPQDRLFLIIGSDSLKNLSQWKDYDKICTLIAGLIVYPRENFPIEKPSFVSSPQFFPLNCKLLDESSSELRSLLSAPNQQSFKRSFPEKILNIIQKNHLYS